MMLDSLLIHPETLKQLNRFMKQPQAPMMLTGGTGSGKRQIAREISTEILALKSSIQLNEQPFFLNVIKPEGKQDISIEQIRQVIRFLRLKTTGKGNVRRVILISDAQEMNQEAQNALLKVLEEPNHDTLFVLTATSASDMLPTAASRVQKIEVKPVSLSAALGFFSKSNTKQEIEVAWRISQGKAGLLEALLDASKPHPLKDAIEQVKKMLTMDRYERLIELENLSKNKDSFSQFLDAMGLVLGALHHSAISKDTRRQSDKLLASRQEVLELKKKLAANTSLKLISADLALKLEL